MTGVVRNKLQKVKVVFLYEEESTLIKLIEPTKDNQSHINFVNRGGGFHHLCFRFSDLKETMAQLSAKGLITLVGPQSGEAFKSHEIAFLFARYGLNIELIDTDEKAERLLTSHSC